MSWLDYFLATPPKPPASGPQNQQDALSLLHAAATGQTPSAAGTMLRTQTANNINGAAALANTIRSRSPAAAARTAVDAANDANANATQQALTLRAQEQAVAQQGFAQAANGARQGDLAQEQIDEQNAATKNAFLGGLFGGASAGAIKAFA